MQVKLISVTKSWIDNFSAEQLLVYIARVSNPSNQMNTETADKLLGYLIKNKHWSPFDMVNMTVEVKTSRAIAQQILRHWSIKPQEFSQRYAEATEYEPIQLRYKAETNRQSSTRAIAEIRLNGFTIDFENNDVGLSIDLLEKCVTILKDADQLYKDLIAAGVAKECARMVLPLTTQTTLYLNGSVRSWIHYLEQRCDFHAQLEHRQVAEEIKKIFQIQFPNISKYLYGGS